MLILSESQDRCRPNTPRLDVSSMRYAGIVHNVLEELGDKQLFLNQQCSTDISFLLLLLSSMLSIGRQTNKDFVENDSEDVLVFSRNEPLHHLLVVLVETVEEDGLLSSKPRTQR